MRTPRVWTSSPLLSSPLLSSPLLSSPLLSSPLLSSPLLSSPLLSSPLLSSPLFFFLLAFDARVCGALEQADPPLTFLRARHGLHVRTTADAACSHPRGVSSHPPPPAYAPTPSGAAPPRGARPPPTTTRSPPSRGVVGRRDRARKTKGKENCGTDGGWDQWRCHPPPPPRPSTSTTRAWDVGYGTGPSCRTRRLPRFPCRCRPEPSLCGILLFLGPRPAFFCVGLLSSPWLPSGLFSGVCRRKFAFFCNHGANGCEWCALLVSMCPSETDRHLHDGPLCSTCFVKRTRVDLNDVRHSVLSDELSGVCVFFFNKDPLHAR